MTRITRGDGPIAFDPDAATPREWAQMYRSHGLQVVPAHAPRPKPEEWKFPTMGWTQLQGALIGDDAFAETILPKFNTPQMGAVTGTPSGRLLAVDGDTYKNSGAREWWTELMVVHNNGMELETWTQRSGGGGVHRFFQVPEGVELPRTNSNPNGIDIRCERGFIMLAPSGHESGSRYKFHDGYAPWECPLLAAPEWLLDHIYRLQGARLRPRGERWISANPPSSDITKDAFGKIVDGREGYMSRLVWAALVQCRRNSNVMCPRGFTEEMEAAWGSYILNVAPRAPGPGSLEERLDRENRGRRLFELKWRSALRKWDGELRAAAAEAQDEVSALPTASPAEAAALMTDAISAFFCDQVPEMVRRQRNLADKAGLEWVVPSQYFNRAPSPRAGLVSADLGLGKTEAVIRQIIRALDGAYFKDGEFEKPLAPLTIDYRVGDHRLAAELVERLNASAPGSADLWKGMGQPGHIGGTMCRRLDDARLWRAAGGAQRDMCAVCPHGPQENKDCEWFFQEPTAQVIVSATPDAIAAPPIPGVRNRGVELNENEFSGADLVIIDETRPTAGLGGFDEPFLVEPSLFTGRLRRPHGFPSPLGWREDDWTILDHHLERVDRLLQGSMARTVHGETGNLSFGELRGVFPEPDGWRLLEDRLQAIKEPPPNHLSTWKGGLLEANLTTYRTWNTRLAQMAQFAAVAAQTLEARSVEGRPYPDPVPSPLMSVINHAEGGTGVVLRWRQRLPEGSMDRPMLILDATADVELLRPFLPHIEVLCEARAAVPDAVEIVQVTDTLCPYNGWSPKEPGPVEGAPWPRTWNNAVRVANFLDVKCAEAGSADVGFIGPKNLVRFLESIWASRRSGRPCNLLTGHFGAIAGLDAMKAVRFLVVVSRPQKPPTFAAQVASTITSRPPVVEAGERYLRGLKPIRRRDGTTRLAARSETHPDADGERVRVQLTDGQLMQAIGRARHLRRDATSPLTIYIVTGTPLPLPVDREATLGDVLRFDEIDALEARGVHVPTGNANKGAAPLLAAALGCSADAVRQKLSRRGLRDPLTVTDINKDPHIDVRHSDASTTTVRVKTPGARFRTAVELQRHLAVDPQEGLAREGVAITELEFEGDQPSLCVPPEVTSALVRLLNYYNPNEGPGQTYGRKPPVAKADVSELIGEKAAVALARSARLGVVLQLGCRRFRLEAPGALTPLWEDTLRQDEK